MNRTQRTSIAMTVLATAIILVCASGIGAALFGSAPAVTVMPPPTEPRAQRSEALSSAEQVLLMSAHVQGATAARKVALLVPGLMASDASSQVCADGGTVSSMQGSTGTTHYVFAGCSKEGYTYSGVASVSFVVTAGAAPSFTVDHHDLQVQGPAGLNATIAGHSACVAANAAVLPRCVTRYAGYHWGDDALGATAAAGSPAGADNVVAVLSSY